MPTSVPSLVKRAGAEGRSCNGTHILLHPHPYRCPLPPDGGLLLLHSTAHDRRPECRLHPRRVNETGKSSRFAIDQHFSNRATQPHVTTLDKPSEASAFIAILLAFIGLSDLTAASLDEDTTILFFLATVPVRLTFLFVLTAYVYLFKEDGVFGGGSMLRKAGVGDNLQNSLVFTFGFLETTFWFWVGFEALRAAESERLTRDRFSRVCARIGGSGRGSGLKSSTLKLRGRGCNWPSSRPCNFYAILFALLTQLHHLVREDIRPSSAVPGIHSLGLSAQFTPTSFTQQRSFERGPAPLPKPFGATTFFTGIADPSPPLPHVATASE